jgi:hypothetical protein
LEQWENLTSLDGKISLLSKLKGASPKSSLFGVVVIPARYRDLKGDRIKAKKQVGSAEDG